MVKEGKYEHDTVSISAQIPAEIGEMLNRVSRAEERSKSYYIRKGLELFLRSRLEDLEDYKEAAEAYEEFTASGEKTVSFSDIKKELDL
ncbi:MAG: hypothetical protein F4Y78_05715 [Candidatus Dadabacteria bacterium]|nr:hypothetical protein [Candidatus Dadabacteria bacterium]MYA47770.1 hypothetical protein [Candidatus Dadabacteria bacterium]MYK48794.1 hypothetical protein [Candidatus Dadabacteria bacterium]